MTDDAVHIPASGEAVLAPQSGGCARHVLSRRVTFALNGDGMPLLTLDGDNTSALRLLTQSTVSLILDDVPTAGEALHLTGLLTPVGDKLWRLETQRRYRVLESGEKRPL